MRLQNGCLELHRFDDNHERIDALQAKLARCEKTSNVSIKEIIMGKLMNAKSTKKAA